MLVVILNMNDGAMYACPSCSVLRDSGFYCVDEDSCKWGTRPDQCNCCPQCALGPGERGCENDADCGTRKLGKVIIRLTCDKSEYTGNYVGAYYGGRCVKKSSAYKKKHH